MVKLNELQLSKMLKLCSKGKTQSLKMFNLKHLKSSLSMHWNGLILQMRAGFKCHSGGDFGVRISRGQFNNLIVIVIV